MTDKPKTLREEIKAKQLNSLPLYRNNEREAEDSTTTTKETTKPFTLTDTQYALVCSLFHELNEEFYRLSPTVQLAYYGRLYKK